MHANLSTFDTLQNNARASMGYSGGNVFNGKDSYTGLPADLDYWVTKIARGIYDNPETKNKRYVIFKSINGNYKLQETSYVESTSANPFENKMVAEGTKEAVFAEYGSRTGETPQLRPGLSEDDPASR